jgi:hypothetical protein
MNCFQAKGVLDGVLVGYLNKKNESAFVADQKVIKYNTIVDVATVYSIFA